MTKTAKQILFILIFIILVVVAFGAFSWIQKTKLEKEVSALTKNLDENRSKVQQLAGVKDRLEKEVKKLASENKNLAGQNTELEGLLKSAEDRASKIEKEIDIVTQERDALNRRMEIVKKERASFEAKAKELQAKLKSGVSKPASDDGAKMSSMTTAASPSKDSSYKGVSKDDEYMASLIKSKADLEVKIEEMKREVSNQEITVVNLKEENAGLKIEIDELKHDNESISREIEHKESLINNISLELARAKNDKKFVSDRVSKLNKENQELRGQMKQLVSTKSALEKSIVRLSEDRNQIERKLGQSETIIQSKIDEIWDIKDSIDQTFRATQGVGNSNEVELPPIVVSSSGGNAHYTASANLGFDGRVVSINEDNNFVIVDIGESQGIRLGDTISVYRDSKYVARLEVIQVRKDISAADIKDQWSKIRVGDIIK